jgi:hypothetical protein
MRKELSPDAEILVCNPWHDLPCMGCHGVDGFRNVRCGEADRLSDVEYRLPRDRKWKSEEVGLGQQFFCISGKLWTTWSIPLNG